MWIEKSFRGRTYHGNERSSFIIGPDGRVEHVLPPGQGHRARRAAAGRARRMSEREGPPTALLAIGVTLAGVAVVLAVLGLMALLTA